MTTTDNKEAVAKLNGEVSDYTVALLQHTARLLRTSDFLLNETERFRLNAVENYQIVDEQRYQSDIKLAAAQRRIAALEAASTTPLEAAIAKIEALPRFLETESWDNVTIPSSCVKLDAVLKILREVAEGEKKS